LDWVAGSGSAKVPSPAARPALGRMVAWTVAGVTLVAVSGYLAGRALHGASNGGLVQSRILLPESPQGFLSGSNVALAPDGSAIAVTIPDSTGIWRLLLRRLGAEDAIPFDCQHGARMPFWSPDGRDVGYATDEEKLVRRSV